MLSREKKGNEKRLRCTYHPLNDAQKSSLKFESFWNEVPVLLATNQSKSMRTFRTEIGTGNRNIAGSVFGKQTRLFPFSMMKRYEFMEMKFQGKLKNVYMYQVEHGKNYLSVYSAINQAVVILKAVFGIKQMG